MRLRPICFVHATFANCIAEVCQVTLEGVVDSQLKAHDDVVDSSIRHKHAQVWYVPAFTDVSGRN